MVSTAVRPTVAFAAGAIAVAAGSALVVPPAPSYDPWAWLLWGREVLAGELDTTAGPAFKPLPVGVCALLSGFGGAAPWLWVLLARTAALAAAGLAFRTGRRLGGGSVVAGVVAGGAVLLTRDYLFLAASGLSEALLLALALAGAEAWRAGRPRWVLACGVGCALLRVEAWPFLAAAGAILWRRHPGDRPLLAAAAVAVPAAWFLPELAGSGDLLRSADRARIPNPGQPALADVPALASLREAVALPPWPAWAGVALLARRAWLDGSPAARRALAPAAAGLAWIALVAALAAAGFSGEARYALPGAALVAVSGAVGLVRGAAALAAGAVPAAAAAGVAALTLVLVLAGVGAGAVAAAPRLAALAAAREEQVHQWSLQADLARAVRAAGGREAVLDCGRPYVGPLRGPLLAYRLGVAKQAVEPDAVPAAPGVVFRSAFLPGAPVTPAVPEGAGFAPVARTAMWDVHAACPPGTGASPSPAAAAGAPGAGRYGGFRRWQPTGG